MALMDVSDVVEGIVIMTLMMVVCEDGECNGVDDNSVSGDDDEPLESTPAIPKHQETSGCTRDMSNKSP